MDKNAQGSLSAGEMQCPSCGLRGRRVQPVTMHSLLNKEARHRLGDDVDFLFCSTHECDVVYFKPHSDFSFKQSDVAVPIFQKSSDPARPVCYCFGFSVEQIESEVQRHHSSGVPDQITENCRQRLDRCPEKNPQGACCLGNVLKVVKAAQKELSLSEETLASLSPTSSGPAATGCCGNGTASGQDHCSKEEA